MSIDDLKSLKLKVRKDADRSSLDAAHQTMIRNWNKLDSALYDHFLEVHNKKVDEYGREKMATELKLLEGKVEINLSASSVGWSTFSLRVFSKSKSLIEAISV